MNKRTHPRSEREGVPEAQKGSPESPGPRRTGFLLTVLLLEPRSAQGPWATPLNSMHPELVPLPLVTERVHPGSTGPTCHLMLCDPESGHSPSPENEEGGPEAAKMSSGLKKKKKERKSPLDLLSTMDL